MTCRVSIAGREFDTAEAISHRCWTFAAHVRSARGLQGATIATFASQCQGISNEYIEAIERGRYDPYAVPPALMASIIAVAGPLPTSIADATPQELVAGAGVATAANSSPAAASAAGEDEGPADRPPGVFDAWIHKDTSIKIGAQDGSWWHVHPDFADQIALKLIRLAATARASLEAKGA